MVVFVGRRIEHIRDSVGVGVIIGDGGVGEVD